MYTHRHQIRIRYAETDQMGYVYYGNYATFYEVGRVEAMRALGFSYKRLEDSGIMLPVLDCQSNFLIPAQYDELITLETSITEMPSVRIRFYFKIYNEAQRLIHTGQTTLAFVDSIHKRPVRPPKELLTILEPYFERG